MKARDEASHRDEGKQLGAEARAEDGLEALEQRFCGGPEDLGAWRNARVQEECEKGRHDEREQAVEQTARQITRRGTGLFAGQRKLLNREEEPNRKRER